MNHATPVRLGIWLCYSRSDRPSYFELLNRSDRSPVLSRLDRSDRPQRLVATLVKDFSSGLRVYHEEGDQNRAYVLILCLWSPHRP